MMTTLFFQKKIKKKNEKKSKINLHNIHTFAIISLQEEILLPWILWQTFRLCRQLSLEVWMRSLEEKDFQKIKTASKCS